MPKPGPRPFTFEQTMENELYLHHLRATGSPAIAARAVGATRRRFAHRRAAHAYFDAACEAALLAAHAKLKLAGGKRLPSRLREGSGEGLSAPKRAPSRPAHVERSRDTPDSAQPTHHPALRATGGELAVARGRNGRLRLLRAKPGAITARAAQAFLRALAAGANVRLAAAATGFSANAWYVRRKEDLAFAREWARALEIGCSRLEAVAIERSMASLEGRGPDSAWVEAGAADAPPPMSMSEILALLQHHQRTARQEEAYDARRAPARMTPRIRGTIRAKIDAVERAARHEEHGTWRLPEELAPPELPPLDQVTGWSRADPEKPPHHEGVPGFGGWRIEDMRRSARAKGR